MRDEWIIQLPSCLNYILNELTIKQFQIFFDFKWPENDTVAVEIAKHNHQMDLNFINKFV